MFTPVRPPFPPLTPLRPRPPHAPQVAPEERLPSVQEARLKLKQLSDERAAKWPNTLEARWLCCSPARRTAASGSKPLQRLLLAAPAPWRPGDRAPGIRGWRENGERGAAAAAAAGVANRASLAPSAPHSRRRRA